MVQFSSVAGRRITQAPENHIMENNLYPNLQTLMTLFQMEGLLYCHPALKRQVMRGN